jgi:hypothetical protein
METTSKKNAQEGVSTYWYPLEQEEPLPDKYYNEISKKLAGSPALTGRTLKNPKNHHNAVLRRLSKRLGTLAMDNLQHMLAVDFPPFGKRKQRCQDQYQS